MNPGNAIPPNIFDAGSLTSLRHGAKTGDPKALKAAAQQFEALFLQMVLKSMRDATPRDGLLDSEQGRLYESLLDQQLGQVLAAKGGMGLAGLIERQLARGNEPADVLDGLPLSPAVPPRPLSRATAPIPLEQATPPAALPLDAPARPPGDASNARDFVSRLWPHAREVSGATGIPAHFMLAQAALETGWGRSEPRHADGRSSFNLFGLKAGRNWSGPVAETATTEYINGQAQTRTERFRAYASYGEAFRDYANLLLSNPRYAPVLASRDAAEFARGLQGAGYATDPAYASKLERIIGGATLRQALLG